MIRIGRDLFYVLIIEAKRAQVSGTYNYPNEFKSLGPIIFSVSPAVNHSFRALEISMYVLPVVTGLKNLFCSSWRGEEVRSEVSLRKVRKQVCELKFFSASIILQAAFLWGNHFHGTCWLLRNILIVKGLHTHSLLPRLRNRSPKMFLSIGHILSLCEFLHKPELNKNVIQQ